MASPKTRIRQYETLVELTEAAEQRCDAGEITQEEYAKKERELKDFIRRNPSLRSYIANAT